MICCFFAGITLDCNLLCFFAIRVQLQLKQKTINHHLFNRECFSGVGLLVVFLVNVHICVCVCSSAWPAGWPPSAEGSIGSWILREGLLSARGRGLRVPLSCYGNGLWHRVSVCMRESETQKEKKVRIIGDNTKGKLKSAEVTMCKHTHTRAAAEAHIQIHMWWDGHR